MQLQDRKAFVEVVAGFALIKGKELSAPAYELYWRALQHWSLPDFKMAAEQLLRTCEWMPTPKDFEDLRKAGRPTSAEAWSKARSALKGKWQREYTASDMTCGDPFIDAVVHAIGGYTAIALCDVDKLHFLERRFSEHYAVLQDAADTRAAVPLLTCQTARSLPDPRHALELTS